MPSAAHFLLSGAGLFRAEGTATDSVEWTRWLFQAMRLGWQRAESCLISFPGHILAASMFRFWLAVFATTCLLEAGFQKAVAGGSQFFLLLQDDGTVLAFGENESGNLGPGAARMVTRPTRVALPAKAVDIAAGRCTSFAVLEDGRVFSWGCNESGMLGRGSENTNETSPAPAPVRGITGGVRMDANNDAAGVVDASGNLWMWGVLYNDRSGPAVKAAAPRRVEGLPEVTSFSVNNRDYAGVSHMFALGRDGSLWAWGFGEQGRLGLGNTASSPTPQRVKLPPVVSVAAGGNNGVAVLADGTVRAWGNNDSSTMGNGKNEQFSDNPLPMPVVGISGAASVSAGYGHIIVLLKNGTMRTWGHDGWGQAGVGTSGGYQMRPAAPKLSGVTAAFATRNRCFAISSGGRLWFWSLGHHKLPGVMSSDRKVPTEITALW